MLRHLILAGSAVALVAFAEPLRAQQPATAPEFEVVPYAGYMMFGDYLDGPLGTSLSTTNGAVLGAQASMHVTPNVSVYGNVGRVSSSLRIGVPLLGGTSAGSSTVWLYDGGVQWGFPIGGGRGAPVEPFLQVGAGAVHYNARAGFVDRGATNFAANAGVGLDYAIAPSVGVRAMVKDYIGRFDFEEATGVDVRGRLAHNWALSAGLTLGF